MEGGEINYSIYPTNFVMLSYFMNASIKQTGDLIEISEVQNNSISTVIVGPYNNSKQIIYQGNIKMFSICFKPLGIYNFEHFDLYYLNNQIISNSKYFDIKKIPLEQILKENSIDYLFDAIEKEFENAHFPIDHPSLRKALNLVSNNANISLADLSKRTDLSQKTLIKLFKKFVGRTPNNFSVVQNIRNANFNDSDRLTDLSYKMGFFDQSHMIKRVKKITGLTPKKFSKLNNISGNQQMKWMQS